MALEGQKVLSIANSLEEHAWRLAYEYTLKVRDGLKHFLNSTQAKVMSNPGNMHMHTARLKWTLTLAMAQVIRPKPFWPPLLHFCGPVAELLRRIKSYMCRQMEVHTVARDGLRMAVPSCHSYTYLAPGTSDPIAL